MVLVVTSLQSHIVRAVATNRVHVQGTCTTYATLETMCFHLSVTTTTGTDESTVVSMNKNHQAW